MKGKYDDIYLMPHHVSQKHPRMTIEARSAQFAPFSALTGYEDLIEETSRITEEKKELSEDEKDELDRKIIEISKRLNSGENITLSVTYFKDDLKKCGGEYINYIGKLKKINKYKQEIVLEDCNRIDVNKICNIIIIENEEFL